VPTHRPLAIWVGRAAEVGTALPRLRAIAAGLSGRRGVVRHGGTARGDIRVFLEKGQAIHPQGYRISIGQLGVEIHASGGEGVWNAVCTLGQIAGQAGRRWPALEIADEPDISVRGFMLDISRDKVPTSAELRRLIDWLSSIKINQLQLYFEHTFRYKRHPLVWRNQSPLGAREIRGLDRYCRKRHIELVPNQNSLGHMERWLKHPRYTPLAEATGPWRSPFGDIRTTKATLCPTDSRSLALVGSMYAELLPNFSSRLFNVGCDEPFELGQGRSREQVRRRGAAAVYADYLLKLRRLARARGRRMMCWADMVGAHPKLLRTLPKDIVLLEWGYEGDHPFRKRCEQYARARFDFYVCPGTSSWCSFSGRLTNALENMRNAVSAATHCGASGYLITDWGDFGHRQYWPASVIPTLFGASLAWNSAGTRERDVFEAAALHGFDVVSAELAAAWAAVGDLYLESGVRLRNKTALFRVMQARLDDKTGLEGLSRAGLSRMRGRLEQIGRLRIDRSLAADELRATVRVLGHAISRAEMMLAIARGEDVRRRAAQMEVEMVAIMREHRRLWQARNRPGGLRDSEAYYGVLMREYAAWARAKGGRR